ncbi:MAG: class I SAM-dependent methyltransferase [Flavobacteriales bacterium]|nr:class I SAM-dependent methyltransferase [Flavobacteriales bacterium]
MDWKQRARSYLRYRKASVNRHGVHSPFLFDLIEKVFKGPSTGISEIEEVRKGFLNDDSPIDFEEHGAGSSFKQRKSTATAASIASRSLSTPAQCMFLHRLCAHRSAKHILELGTSLGVSTAYLASAGAEVHTIEASAAVHHMAQSRFGPRFPSIQWHLGPFDEQLPKVLQESDPFDVVYVDGNHREASTVQYVEAIIPHLSEDAVMILDDIHWSEGMERAWDTVRDHREVTLSVDVFWCGMLFFKKGLSGEHFTIRY